jgi:hypothetical protein
MRKLPALLLIAAFFIFTAALPRPRQQVYETAAQGSEELLERAKKADPERFDFAKKSGAEIIPTPDGRSFYLLWFPETAAGDGKKVIVSLHGHGSWAFDEFYLWKKSAQEAGVGILALQWWFGGGDTPRDYYTPHEMYPIIESALSGAHIRRGHAFLHGFSRGAANVYAVAALDFKQDNHFFGLVLASSGGFTENYPPNREILSGAFGDKIYEGSHWMLYCGMKDEHPERDGCEAMTRTQGIIQRFGGTVDLLIKDTSAGHGGFHWNPQYIKAALDLFQKLAGAAPASQTGEPKTEP